MAEVVVNCLFFFSFHLVLKSILGLCEGNCWITRDCCSSSFPVQLASELADCGMISGHKGGTDSSLSGTERKIGPVS